jgi:hypothetical protein
VTAPAVSLSADDARLIALAAQGLDRPRPTGRVTRTHLRRVIDTVGMIQIDSVIVLVRAQELPLFSRLGPHPRTLIPDAVAAGELFETWAHAACLVPTARYPLYRWRMDEARRNATERSIAVRNPALVESVLAQVRDRGPLAVGDLHGRVRNRAGAWWDWDDGKIALEHLFQVGDLVATRRPDFGRLYDLPERVIPAAVREAPVPSEDEARRAMVLDAARALGVASVKDLAFYHYQLVPKVKAIVAELASSGALPVTPRGVRASGCRNAGSRQPSTSATSSAPDDASSATIALTFGTS